MTREEELDWLCRLRSEIYVFMPKEWLIPMNNALDMAIQALEQEPRWIPVSERLPDTEDEVLCWYEYYHWSQEKILPEYGIGQFFDNRWFGEVSVGKDIKVLAWMPLPKPYEPQESEEDNG